MRGGYVNNQSIPFVRTDPENRCAAMLVFGRQVRAAIHCDVIVLFKQIKIRPKTSL